MDKIKSFCRTIKNKVTKAFHEKIFTHKAAATVVDLMLITLSAFSAMLFAVFLSYSDMLGIMSRAKEVCV